jgi:LPXTG-motif cell wall-anchored protein
MRKIMLTAAIAGALLLVAPVAAYAVDNVDSTPAPVQTDDTYTPDEPIEPTLAGSTAVGECIKDVPYIFYSVALTDPDDQATSNFARLVLTDGVNTHTIDLGELVDGKLNGQTLWPGAAVTDGVASGWPGWAFENGEWVETDGNFRWTRGSISAKIEVNPEVSVPLSYPPATPNCAVNPVLSELPSTDELPATGLSATVFAIAIAGGAVLLVGLTFLIVQRRRSRI